MAGLCGLAAVFLYPTGNALIRATEAGLAGLLALGLLGLWWHHRLLRWTLLGLSAAAAVFLAFPGRSDYDRMALRREVAHALARHEGVRYWNGGENFLGMGPFGLARRGAIDALFVHGLRTGNPLLVRKAFAFWWSGGTETAAVACGIARKVTGDKPLSALNPKNLHPGDVAVTADGLHVLVLLGEDAWLEADPAGRKVLRHDFRKPKSPWMQTPVTILRWRCLELRTERGNRGR